MHVAKLLQPGGCINVGTSGNGYFERIAAVLAASLWQSKSSLLLLVKRLLWTFTVDRAEIELAVQAH